MCLQFLSSQCERTETVGLNSRVISRRNLFGLPQSASNTRDVNIDANCVAREAELQ